MKPTLPSASRTFALLACLILAIPNVLRAQADPTSSHPTNPDTMKVFYLKYAGQPNDSNEIVNGVRQLMDASTRVYLAPTQNALIVRGNPDQIALAAQIIDALDKPGKIFRLTYTMNESDAGKRIGSQHFALLVHAGQRTTLKQGSKIPIATGAYGPTGLADKPSGVQTQFTYLDIGYNFDAALAQDGQTLKTTVEQSSIAEEKSSAGFEDPIVRQSVLQGTVLLTPGKPLTLGSLDLPGGTRHLDVEVLLEPVH